MKIGKIYLLLLLVLAAPVVLSACQSHHGSGDEHAGDAAGDEHAGDGAE